MDVNSRPLRRLAQPAAVTRRFDWPRLWCAATTAAGVVALGAVGTSSVPATQQHKASAIAQSATGDSLPLHRAMPPATTATPVGSSSRKSGDAGSGGLPVAGGAIPALVLTAYLDAQHAVAGNDPGCHLTWQVLAGIGEVESGQANNGDLTADGTTRSPILGPLLDGTGGNAAIPAANGGWARAEGPMQFLPSTWAQWGVDGNADGRADSNNIFDAALAAGHYLCAGGRDLAQPSDLDAAILSYNHSPSYLATVTAWIRFYENTPGTGVAGGPSSVPSASQRPTPSGSSTRPTASPTPTGPSTGPSGTPSPTGRPSRSPSSSPTTSPSGSPSPSSPGCSSGSPSPTGSGSPTPTPSSSPTPSPSPTGSGSPSPSPTGCPSPSPTGTAASPSPSTPAAPSRSAA